MIYAFILWILFAAIWFFVIPQEARGKKWSYAHMTVPGIALAVHALAPAGLAGPVGVWLWGGVAMFVLASIGWCIGSALRNHSIMDVVYPCISFGSAVTMVLVASGEISFRMGVVLGLMAIWMLRMLQHAYGTNMGEEQQPYATHRKRFGSRWPLWSFFAVYMLQGILIWIWVMPFAFAASADVASLQVTDWIGIAVWLVGFFFLVVGDAQMNAFKADPANKGGIMDKGLWSMTRHPNYFGESLVYIGYFMFALAHPWGWISVIGPIYTTWFMGWGSATPGNERHMRKTRGAAWDDYVARVPMFFPGRPRR
ncbi:DUF1295 domain-containing protein [Thalassorhabdomicrobium marinisediminis]|uniref:DUF1295 domain-containing protein n=1 Tax=Thalassorhabdomicrobium marinisediminis TaxID=2170577 RepID=UPI0024922628|nr:DUF1295 domain-containing protein [Thalassorhabdomicrobium marinisediminis]